MTAILSKESTKFEEDRDRDYRRNFAAGLIHGLFFQMSSAFSSIQTVLPSFIALLTTSTAAIGLISSIQGLSEVLPQLFTARLVANKPRKKPYLIAVIMIRWISWGIMAGLTYRYAASRPLLVLGTLIMLFGLFSLAGGAGTVIYADIFARAIPARKRGRFTGTKQLGGFGLAIVAGGVVKVILESETAYPFPVNYAAIFLLSALSLAVALTGFLMIREPVHPVEPSNLSLRSILTQGRSLVGSDPNFQRFLVSRSVIVLIATLSPFYLLHARSTMDLDAGAAGIFLASQMAGAAVSNLWWGWLADRFGNKRVIVGTVISGMLSSAMALMSPLLPVSFYAAVFFALGTMLSGMRIGYSNFLLEMAHPETRVACVALQNTLTLPVSIVPLLIGYYVQADSLSVMFALEIMLLLISLAAALAMRDPRHDNSGVCSLK